LIFSEGLEITKTIIKNIFDNRIRFEFTVGENIAIYTNDNILVVN
jgi:hypothetical protein